VASDDSKFVPGYDCADHFRNWVDHKAHFVQNTVVDYEQEHKWTRRIFLLEVRQSYQELCIEAKVLHLWGIVDRSTYSQKKIEKM
jgi:hypothetical protein